jgi:Ca2+/Na+ antiporter
MDTNGKAQALKLIRVLRLIRMFQDLWVLVLGLYTAMKALMWLFLLLIIFMYVCAIVLTSQVGRMVQPEDPHYEEIRMWFGSVGESMFRLFQVMTGEEWPVIAEKTSERFPGMRVFFVIFILFSTFALMNLVTGIIVDKVMSTAKQCAVEQEEADHADGTKDLTILRKAFKKMCNKSGALDLDHFTLGLEKPDVLDTLKDLDIFLGTDPDTIFNILDINGSGTLDEMEFARGVLRMKGSTQSRHLLFVQNDLHKHCKRILNMSQEISNKLVVEAKRASHVQDHLDQIWHFMRRQASNRWITDPFHSSLHQMISEIYLLTREMHEKQKGPEASPEKASPQKH